VEERLAWLEIEREVREHRRWRQLIWLIVVWPLIIALAVGIVLGLTSG
jgi:uncharacterized membrane protein YdfJ with MMPL/SSD domain